MNEWKEILRRGQWWQRKTAAHVYNIVDCGMQRIQQAKRIKSKSNASSIKKINRKIEMWKNVYAHEWEELIMMLCRWVCVRCVHQHFVCGFDGCVKRLRFDNNVYIAYIVHSKHGFLFQSCFRRRRTFLNFLPFACNLFIASFQFCIYNFNAQTSNILFLQMGIVQMLNMYSIGPINLSIELNGWSCDCSSDCCCLCGETTMMTIMWNHRILNA